MDMFEEMKVYEPVMITSVELAEAVPVGTVAVGFNSWDTHREFPITEVKRGPDEWTGEYPDYSSRNKDVIGWTALLETNYRTLLEGFTNYLEGGTQWMDDSPTEEELNLITAISVIREAIGQQDDGQGGQVP